LGNFIFSRQKNSTTLVQSIINHILVDYITFMLQIRIIAPQTYSGAFNRHKLTGYIHHTFCVQKSLTLRLESVCFSETEQYIITLYTSLTSQMCRIYLCRYGTMHKNIARNNHYASYSTYLYCQR